MLKYQWTQADVDAHNAKLSKGRGVRMLTAAVEGAIHETKRSKYRNVRCEIDGQKFDSKAEAEFWLELKLRERAGEIRDLKRQVLFLLYCPVQQWHEVGTITPSVKAEVARYVSDFTWIDGTTGRLVVADKKGHRTREYLLKRKWMALQYGIEILEV